jgi:hypothetical protein
MTKFKNKSKNIEDTNEKIEDINKNKKSNVYDTFEKKYFKIYNVVEEISKKNFENNITKQQRYVQMDEYQKGDFDNVGNTYAKITEIFTDKRIERIRYPADSGNALIEEEQTFSIKKLKNEQKEESSQISKKEYRLDINEYGSVDDNNNYIETYKLRSYKL